MTRWIYGYLYWGIGWLLLGFLAAELAGFYRLAPWPTLSSTVWHSERYPLVALFLFALLLGLMAHFFYHRPLWASMTFGVVVSVTAHLVDKHLP